MSAFKQGKDGVQEMRSGHKALKKDKEDNNDHDDVDGKAPWAPRSIEDIYKRFQERRQKFCEHFGMGAKELTGGETQCFLGLIRFVRGVED